MHISEIEKVEKLLRNYTRLNEEVEHLEECTRFQIGTNVYTSILNCQKSSELVLFNRVKNIVLGQLREQRQNIIKKLITYGVEL